MREECVPTTEGMLLLSLGHLLFPREGRVAGDKLGKGVFVGIGDGDILFPEDDAVAVDEFYFATLYDKGAVYPYELLVG